MCPEFAVYAPGSLLEPRDAISPREAAQLAGISRTDMYRLISVLEHYVDPSTRELRPLPPDYQALTTRRERNAWRRRHLVVIREWGAESVAHGDWRISRMRLSAWLLDHRAIIPSLLATAA